VVDLACAHALMIGADLVKPVKVAGGSIKGLCVSKEIGFLLSDCRDPHWAIPCL